MTNKNVSAWASTHATKQEDQMLAVRLEANQEAALTHLAASTGRSKSYYVKEALAAYLQDRGDYLLALAALERNERRTSLADVRKELGLAR